MADQILHDFSPRLKVYKDGRVERLRGQETVPPSLDPTTAVQSKDVQIAPEIPLAARLYLPPTPDPTRKLPLIVYFHGGAFISFSAFHPMYHKYLNLLAAEAGAVAVSVNYRLAPENPIPAAYDDAWTTLKWIVSESRDEWITRYADLNRVYLAGDSAGGSISHNTAVRLGGEKLEGMKLSGLLLNCPFFWGEDPIGKEMEVQDEIVGNREGMGKLALLVCPKLKNLDDPWINPGLDPKLAGLACGRVLVYVGEKEILRDRGWAYKAALEKCGWKGDVEVVEVKDEGHVFGVSSPDGENGLAMLKKVAFFIKGN